MAYAFLENGRFEQPSTTEGVDVVSMADPQLTNLLAHDLEVLYGGGLRDEGSTSERLEAVRSVLELLLADPIESEIDIVNAQTTTFTEAEVDRREATIREYAGRVVERLVKSCDLPWELTEENRPQQKLHRPAPTTTRRPPLTTSRGLPILPPTSAPYRSQDRG